MARIRPHCRRSANRDYTGGAEGSGRHTFHTHHAAHGLDPRAIPNTARATNDPRVKPVGSPVGWDSQLATHHCDHPPGHSRAGGNPFLVQCTKNEWIPACAGMTPWLFSSPVRAPGLKAIAGLPTGLTRGPFPTRHARRVAHGSSPWAAWWVGQTPVVPKCCSRSCALPITPPGPQNPLCAPPPPHKTQPAPALPPPPTPDTAPSPPCPPPLAAP